MLAEAGRVMQTAQDLYDELERDAPEILPAYVALVWYPAMGTMNVLKLQLLSGMNHYLAEIGALSANDYAKEAKACLDADQKIIEQYHRSDDARWYGMGLSQHIGFTNWNEDECKNPLLMQVLPLQKADDYSDGGRYRAACGRQSVAESENDDFGFSESGMQM